MSGVTTSEDEKIQLRDEALARSVFYGMLSLALHPPTAEILREMQSDQVPRALRYAASLLSSPPPPQPNEEENSPVDLYRRAVEELAVDLPARAEEWLQTLPSLTLEHLLEWNGRLFGHTARGSVCPYEAEYGPEFLFQQPRQLARIGGFYQAFGLTPRVAERERADHASCELEFLEFLSRKEAYALQAGEEDMLVVTRKAIRFFLRDHLGRFGRAFARHLREQVPQGFFGKLGDLLFDFLTYEGARLGIQLGPAWLELRSADEDNVPMACGEGSDLVQLQTANGGTELC